MGRRSRPEAGAGATRDWAGGFFSESTKAQDTDQGAVVESVFHRGAWQYLCRRDIVLVGDSSPCAGFSIERVKSCQNASGNGRYAYACDRTSWIVDFRLRGRGRESRRFSDAASRLRTRGRGLRQLWSRDQEGRRSWPWDTLLSGLSEALAASARTISSATSATAFMAFT